MNTIIRLGTALVLLLLSFKLLSFLIDQPVWYGVVAVALATAISAADAALERVLQ